MKLIQKLGTARFKISTPGVAASELELNFNPIIEAKNLTGDYLIIHWQARPKGDREWGIYQSSDDSYRSTLGGKINMSDAEMFQLDDKTAKTIPSAVLITNESRVTCINDRVIVGQVYMNDLKL